MGAPRSQNPSERALKLRAWRAKNPDHWRRYKEKHPETLAKHNLAWKRRNSKKRKAIQKKATLKFLYGLTPEQREAMGNECEICGSGFRPSVDHDHDTGAVRGILCAKCNPGLGLFEDSPSRLRAAADYLERKRTS